MCSMYTPYCSDEDYDVQLWLQVGMLGSDDPAGTHFF